MDTCKLTNILSCLKEEIEKSSLLPKTKKAILAKELEKARVQYANADFPEQLDRLYQSLIGRGNGLLSELGKIRDSAELFHKATYFIRYANAAMYDINSDIKGLKYYTRSFIITAALFMALTPQFYGFILPVLFVIPIFAGLKGVKQRSRNALLMTLAVVPMALMSSITWIRYFFETALPDFEQTVAVTASTWKVGEPAAQMLIIVPSLLAVVLMLFSIFTGFLGYKYRNMFI